MHRRAPWANRLRLARASIVIRDACDQCPGSSRTPARSPRAGPSVVRLPNRQTITKIGRASCRERV